jgi:hypothetical protein
MRSIVSNPVLSLAEGHTNTNFYFPFEPLRYTLLRRASFDTITQDRLRANGFISPSILTFLLANIPTQQLRCFFIGMGPRPTTDKVGGFVNQ